MLNHEFNDIVIDVISKSIFSKLKITDIIELQRIINTDNNEYPSIIYTETDTNIKILEYLKNINEDDTNKNNINFGIPPFDTDIHQQAELYKLPPLKKIIDYMNYDNLEGVILNKLKIDISHHLFNTYNMNLFLFDGSIKKIRNPPDFMY